MLYQLALVLAGWIALAQADIDQAKLNDIITKLKASPQMKWRYGVPEDNTPTHFHLAFAGSVPGGSMSILWETDSDTPTHVCKYGTQPGQLTSTATGTSTTYGYEYIHTVIVSGLTPSTTYYYSCGDATYGFSPENSFISGLSANSRSQYSVAFVGDMGIKQSNGVAASMIKHMDTYDFVYHCGDLGYADDWYLYLSTYEHVYATFMSEIEPLSSKMAYMGLPGNHEATCDEAIPKACPSHLANFTAYRTRWRFPSAESGGAQNMWYSFDYGVVHWVQISTETDFTGAPEGPTSRIAGGPFGDQMTWLKNDLIKANNNRANVPWIIVTGHRPVWFTGGVDKYVQQAFLPLLTEYKVDIYFAGHEHLYERYYPITPTGTVSQPNYTNPVDPVYIVQGAGGNVEGHSRNSATAPYLVYRDETNFGWSRLTFFNASSVKWEWITDKDVTADSVIITKPYK